MSKAHAILVEGLGKRYKMWSGGEHSEHLRDMLVQSAKAIFSSKARRRTEGDFWALRDASFEIGHGENVGIIGLNGAGKSTLLKLLSRIAEPTTGSARIDGRVGALLEVGTGFALELSGRDNVFLYGSILGMSRADVARKFDAIVEFAGVEKHIDVPVKRYSSGMYVKLAFAVAAHLDPEILFLDEVLAVGDLAFQRKCFDFAKDLQKRDATILFVSHNMFNIKTMCSRVIYLKQGRVEFDGSVEGGIERYERDCRLSVLSWDGGGAPETWPIFIDHCELRSADGSVKSMFDFGESVKIKLDYQVRSPMQSPNFMVSIVRSDGVVACTYSTERDGIDMGTISANGTLELDLPPLKLVAEMYSVNVTVRHKGFQDIVCMQLATTFHVKDELLSHHFGVFNEPGHWQGDAVPAPTPAVESRLRLASARD